MALLLAGRRLTRRSALDEGLTRFFRLPKARKARVRFVFELIRRIHEVAPYITDRDNEIARAVLEDLDFSRAARELGPHNPQSMRVRISTRYAYFQALCEYFFSPSAERSRFRPNGRSKRIKKLQP